MYSDCVEVAQLALACLTAADPALHRMPPNIALDNKEESKPDIENETLSTFPEAYPVLTE